MKCLAVRTFVFAILAATTCLGPLAHAQISLGVEGDSTVAGNLSVGGTITVGSSHYVLTNAAGLLDGARLQSGTVGTSQLAAGAATTTSLATGAVTAQKLATGAVTGVSVASGAITPDKLDQAGTYLMSKLGIGTTAVPNAGIGYGQLALHGSTDYQGPNFMLSTTQDIYPVVGIVSTGHDSSAIRFDSYHDYVNSTYRQISACASSNAMIQKMNDSLMLRYAHGHAQGAVIAGGWITGFKMSCTDGTITMSGSVVTPAIYNQTALVQSATNPLKPLYIDSTGKIGWYVPPSKSQVVETSVDVAQTVAPVRQSIFDRVLNASSSAEVQRLKKRVDELEARLARLEGKN